MSRGSLLLVIVMTIVAVPAYTRCAAVTGTGGTAAILLTQIIMTVSAVAIACYFALIPGLALEYVWRAEMAGVLVGLALAWYWFKSERWRKLEI